MADLGPGVVRELTAAATRDRRAAEEAAEARAKLAGTIEWAVSGGASLRSIAEASGLPLTRVHRLLVEARRRRAAEEALGAT